MEYRQNDWSILGFGCMRFPKKGGSVDMEETEQEQESAEGDINMIDLRDKQQLPENQEEADTSTLPDGAASAQDNHGERDAGNKS